VFPILTPHLQIDRLNLEGYANLEHWVARLDERIEGTLLHRLTSIIQLWCAQFERNDDREDSAGRRDTVIRDGTLSKRRGDKKFLKDDKVRVVFHLLTILLALIYLFSSRVSNVNLLSMTIFDCDLFSIHIVVFDATFLWLSGIRLLKEH
jgi:hypothetical protein